MFGRISITFLSPQKKSQNDGCVIALILAFASTGVTFLRLGLFYDRKINFALSKLPDAAKYFVHVHVAVHV